MAESKKSFILYADMIHTVRKMSKQKAGELFVTILSYVNDENPVVNDTIIDLVFEPIKQQLKRDLKRWDDFKKKQVENGKLGGRPSKDKEKKKSQKKPNNPSLYEETQKSLNANVSANANVSISSSEVFEFLRMATDRHFISDTQLETETENFIKKYEGRKIGSLRALCNTWADGIIPETKKSVVI